MKIAIEKECTGWKYTGENDEDRSKWDVMTDYVYGKVYLNSPSDDTDIDQIEAFGRAVVKACKDMRREIKDNRHEV